MQDGTETSSGHLVETGPALMRGDVYAADCPTRRLLDRVADKWTTLLLTTLDRGEMRFNALKRRVGGVSQKMLSQTLKQMERDGLVLRHVEATVPVTVTYEITPLGRTLVAALRPLIDWAETRMDQVEAARLRYDGREL